MKTISELKCLRCGHQWLPRTEHKPVRCPKCQSPYWDKPRQVDKAGVINEKET